MAMTRDQVAEWLRAHGVSEAIIADEAGYLADKYADPDEDILRVLAQALPGYLQRSSSGGDRASGGYSTDIPDAMPVLPPDVIRITSPSALPPMLTNPPDRMMGSSFTNIGSGFGGAFTSAGMFGGGNPIMMIAMIGIGLYFAMKKR